jgi:hypothetical protein
VQDLPHREGPDRATQARQLALGSSCAPRSGSPAPSARSVP